MTPQLEVLKHLGHANFDENRSAELKQFYHNDKIASILLIIAVWDDVRMKYGFSLDQKKLHGSYQIVYQQKMAIPTNAEFVGRLLGLVFSPQGAGITPWWVSLTLCLG